MLHLWTTRGGTKIWAKIISITSTNWRQKASTLPEKPKFLPFSATQLEKENCNWILPEATIVSRRKWTGPAGGLPFPVTPNRSRLNRLLSVLSRGSNGEDALGEQTKRKESKKKKKNSVHPIKEKAEGELPTRPIQVPHYWQSIGYN